MIGIIYTGESEKELNQEIADYLALYKNTPKIFVEPNREKEFKSIFCGVYGIGSLESLETLRGLGMIAQYHGIELTSTTIERSKRELKELDGVLEKLALITESTQKETNALFEKLISTINKFKEDNKSN